MTLIIGAVAVVAFILFFLSTYKIVGTNEAHVIVFMGRGRSVKTPVIAEDGTRGKTSYFFIPFLMKRYVLPLTNVKLDIDGISLNDSMMAPFTCDVVTWIHIIDPIKASERLSDTEDDKFTSMHQDLQAIVQAIARAAAMGQEILEIMKDRATFSSNMRKEVNDMIIEWGVELVGLEINDINDHGDSRVIQNYEAQRQAQIDSKTRIEVALRDREAVEQEQENKKLSEVATAEAQQIAQTAQMESEKNIGIAEQEKQKAIATAEKEANVTAVEAYRTLEVGNAEVKKEAAIMTATGEGEAIRIKGEKDANVVQLAGEAEAKAIEAKGIAEAIAKTKMAEALKLFNDAATTQEKIKATVEVQKAYAEAYAMIAEKAEIKIVTSGEGSDLFGIKMNARTGADLGQLFEAFGAEKVAEVIESAKV